MDRMFDILVGQMSGDFVTLGLATILGVILMYWILE